MKLESNLEDLLTGCLKNDRQSQKMLYQYFFSYAMAICSYYTMDRYEATEVLNEGFFKVFTKLEMYDSRKSFKGWIRRIMINTAIDYYRKNNNRINQSESLEDSVNVSTQEVAISKLSYQEIVTAIQTLTPGYRTVFNLYVIDGFNHEEIAKQLGISVGTSKSNLFKARAILQKKLIQMYIHEQR